VDPTTVPDPAVNRATGAIGTTASVAATGADIVSAPDVVLQDCRRRLDARHAVLTAFNRRHASFSRLRLAWVAVAIVVLVSGGLASAGWLLVPIAAFLVTAALHARLLNQRDEAACAVAFYERSLARMTGDWIGRGQQGNAHQPAGHPYARDLDLFGRGSLFELLSTARTVDGEARLAEWLLAPAAPSDVRARQEAVRELAPLTDLREAAAVQGDLVRGTVRTQSLRVWALGPIRLRHRALRVVLPPLALATATALAIFVFTGRLEALALVLLTVQSAIGLWFKNRAHDVVHAVDEPARELSVLSGVLSILERHTFQSALLRGLQDSVRGRRMTASAEIRRFSQWVALLSSRENIFFGPLAALLMWTTQWALAIESWRAQKRPDLVRWIDAVATFEALLSLATFAAEHPGYTYPTMLDDASAQISVRAVAHPVLPPDAVTNDVALGGEAAQAFVVSGSNMSGKSTLLRTLGVTVVLAQAGGPVRAQAVSLSPLVVGAAIQVQDSLTDGRSRFFAEIERLKQIVDLVGASGGRALFLLDEILGGTNSHDRRVGAEALITGLVAEGAIGLVTTHDLSIGAVADRLAPRVTNVHFVDEFHDGTLTFDYRLRPGIVRSSNAIALMKSIGLRV
jgi:hypothetical protein